jgi:WD40 repeat protein/serine/threonine protein kinase
VSGRWHFLRIDSRDHSVTGELMATTHKPIEEILADAVEIDSAAERAEFLDAACADSAELRQELERLIDVHFTYGHLMDAPANAHLLDRASVTGLPETLAPQAPLDGTLGDFQLVREIGRGGMGVVYEGRELSLNRRVAIKVLPFTAVLDQRQLERFKTEAQAAAGLHHANIVPVFHIGHDRAVHYYAMQFIEGQDVSDLIRQMQQVPRQGQSDPPSTRIAPSGLASDLLTGRFEPLDESRPESQGLVDTRTFAALSTNDAASKSGFFRSIVGLGVQAAEALEFAHQNGVLHRDIKPSNLMVDAQGKLWITDFGLARIEGDAGLTMTGDIIGTLRYMSPEQATTENNAVDCRSDVYSLGVTLYEMLSLTPIFPDTDRRELLQKREQDEPTPLRQVNRAISADLETVIHKAISREPADRYSTAQEFADDLQRYLNSEPVHARRPSVAARLSKWSQRNRTLVASLIAAGFIGGIVAASVVVVVKDADGKKVAEIVIPDGGSAIITDNGKTPPHRLSLPKFDVPADNVLPGLIAHPEKLPGIRRWQLITTRPIAPVIGPASLDWSPDGKFITFGAGRDVRVYDVPSFRLVRLFSGHTSAVTSVDWSPDGKRIASASIDKTVRVWDVDTGEPGHVLGGHRDSVHAVAWHPDSRRLVSGGSDNRAMIWTAEGKVERILPGCRSVAWSPDGELLAAGFRGTIRIWDRQGTGDQIGLFDTKTNTNTIAWSPDGGRILTLTQIWNADGTGPVVLEGHTGTVRFADWSPDGTQVATAGWDNTVRLCGADGTTGPILEGHYGEAKCVKWSPDGKWIASGGDDTPVRLWRPDGTAGPTLDARRGIPDFAWHPWHAPQNPIQWV